MMKRAGIIGQNLKVFRQLLGVSAAELGSEIGVTRQMINNIESGRSEMAKQTEMAIIGWLYQIDSKFPFCGQEAINIKKCFTEKVTLKMTLETEL